MKYVKCSCSSEVLGVEYDKDINSFDVFIFKHYNTDSKLSFLDRLRYVWKMLRTGEPYSDQMIIAADAKDFTELLEHFNHISKSTEQSYISAVLEFVARYDLYSRLYWAYDLYGKIKFYFDIQNNEFVNYVPLTAIGIYEINIEDLDKMGKSIDDYNNLHNYDRPHFTGIIAYIEERERIKD